MTETHQKMVTRSFLFVLGVFFLHWIGAVWPDYQMYSLLNSTAKGADTIYHKNVDAYRQASLIASTASNTRSPGSYIQALAMWQSSLHPKNIEGSAQWVRDIQQKERTQVEALLLKTGLTVTDVDRLQSKLDIISPVLSVPDSNAVKLLASTEQLYAIAQVRNQLANEIGEKMHELGYGTQVLRELGLPMKPFYRG